MKLRLYVEDSYYQAYEELAKKWLKTRRLQYREVKASKLGLNKMRDEMLKYVEFAQKDGFTCVVFILDQETPQNSLAAEIRASFKKLCKILPNHATLRDMKVWLVVVKNSLESWLLTEAEAIARFASKTTKYRPKQDGNTELTTPNEAIKKITHIFNQVENKKRGKRGKRRKRRKYEKSEAPDIVKYMSDDLSVAAKRNRSLKYFLRACRISSNLDVMIDSANIAIPLPMPYAPKRTADCNSYNPRFFLWLSEIFLRSGRLRTLRSG